MTLEYNLDKNAILLPTIIVWILVVNYFFRNKLFGKFSILVNDIKINFDNISRSDLSIKKNLLKTQNLNIINYISSKNKNLSTKNNLQKDSSKINNSNNYDILSEEKISTKSNISNSISGQFCKNNPNSFECSNNINSNIQNNSNNIINYENIKENNSHIFSKFHNKDWLNMHLNMSNFYPELLSQNNNISDGKYEYVEINNLKN